jgi:hypothetical protein
MEPTRRDRGGSLSRLRSFRGDLAWLHAREGHEGRPYWPGESSGVTLDPGLDLGHADPDLVASLVRPLLSHEDWKALSSTFGLKGNKAARALAAPSRIRGIRISREVAETLLPLVAAPYWQAISRRFSSLLEAPAPVQTALLSLAYNRGPENPKLEEIRWPLEARDWQTLGKVVKGMQQDHELAGIRSRRRLEGELILSACAPGEAT